MSKKRMLVACLVGALGPSCGGSGGGAGNDAAVGVGLPATNVCGKATASLTKQVPLALGTVPADLEVGPAWIAHSSEGYKLLTVPYYEAAEVASTSPDEQFLVSGDGPEAADALMAMRLSRRHQLKRAKLALIGR
jgi:hypothetical protein